MKILPTSVKLLRHYDWDCIIRDIEETASVSHKSNKKRDIGEAREFVHRLVKLGHLSVLENSMVAFKITTSRDVSHQFVRHRHLQFCQESQRYCNYKDLEFVIPDRIKEGSIPYDILIDQLQSAENYYKALLLAKVPVEVARAVLPNCTATRLIVSGNLRAWVEYLKLRTDKHTQEEHRKIAMEISNILKQNIPEIFVEENNA